MITISPETDFTDPRITKFYRSLIGGSRFNIPSQKFDVEPFAAAGDFQFVANAAGVNERWMDPGNYGAGVIPAPIIDYKMQSMYHGKIELLSYVLGIAGTPTFTTRHGLSLRGSTGSFADFEYKRRTGLTNNDVTWNAYQGTGGLLTGQQQLGFYDEFTTLFALMHTMIDITTFTAGDTVTHLTEWTFVGVRINFT